MQESIASVRTIFKGSGSQKLLTCKTQSYLNLLMKNRTKANKQIRSYEEFNNVCEITFFFNSFMFFRWSSIWTKVQIRKFNFPIKNKLTTLTFKWINYLLLLNIISIISSYFKQHSKLLVHTALFFYLNHWTEGLETPCFLVKALFFKLDLLRMFFSKYDKDVYLLEMKLVISMCKACNPDCNHPC